MARRGRHLMVIAALSLMVLGAFSGCEENKKLSVAGLKPTVGPYTGGDPVIISGSGFQTPTPKSMKIYFGKQAARNVVVLSDSEIRVEPPSGEIGSEVDVDVIFDDARSAKMPKAYKYIDPVGKQQAGEAAAQ